MKILKKVLLIIALIAIIVVIILVANNAKSGQKENKTNQVENITSQKVTNTSTKNTTSQNATNTSSENTTSQNVQDITNLINSSDTSNALKTTIQTLKDGTKYSIKDDGNMDIVVGDNYFDTQIADMSLNFDQYEGKTIEIEGMYFENSPYTFVGRYSVSSMCPTCPTGYSYFEYEWHGDEKLELSDSKNWIKVKGTLTRGDDNGVEYYYIDASSIEIMNEMGVQTVSN